MVILDVYMSFIRIKTMLNMYWLTQWIFQATQELWKALSKAVPGKFRESGGQNKHNDLQDHFISGMAICPNF